MYEKETKTYWVGVRKDRYQDHDVFEDYESKVTLEKYSNYDYCLGPFKLKTKAKERAKTEKNLTGTFTDPFCNNGKGR
jgi:hypothetical protein